MKKITLVLTLTMLSFFAFAQKQNIAWGDEFKMKKGSTDLSVIHTDKSGVYLQEGHLAMKSYFVIGASFRESATLVKLDKSLNELYRTDFNKELKGKEFVEFFPFQDKLLIIASEYRKSEKTIELFGAEIDKKSGLTTGTWKPITSFRKEDKKSEIEFKLMPNADTTKIILVSTITGKEKNSYLVQQFDASLKPTSKPANITNEFEAKTYQLEDVLITSNEKIILVGRMMEYREGKKKKEKFLDFVNYNIRIYDATGKQENEINTNIKDKWLSSTKLMLGRNNELILASFYSKDRKSKTNEGLLVERIDPNTGKVISSAEKQINNSLITTDNGDADTEEDDEKETKEERKERQNLAKLKDEGESFSRYMKFQNIFYTKDNGLVLLAEDYHMWTYTTASPRGGMNGAITSYNYYTNYVYDCRDIMMVKLDASNNISWLQIIPKNQREVYRVMGQSSIARDFFFASDSRPFYAGFGAIQSPSGIQIFFNDRQNNADVTQPGKKVNRLMNFNKSDCFVVTLDEVTGKFQRKSFFTNWNMPVIAMPRLGSVIGSEMYLVGRYDRSLAKTRVSVGRITTK